MNHKKVLMIVSLSLLVLGIVLTNSVSLGVCEAASLNCINKISIALGHPLVIGFGTLTFVVLVLRLLSDSVFQVWKKFAVPAILLGTFLVILTPNSCSAPLDLCFYKTNVTLLYSTIFLIISLLIILYKTLKLRKKPSSLES